MKITFLLLVLFLSCNLSAAPVPKCGEHEAEDPQFDWTTVSLIKLQAPGTQVHGVICAGWPKNSSQILTNIVYRDNEDSVRKYTIQQLMGERQIILNSDDLDIGIVKEGNVMGLSITSEQVSTEQTHYQLNLRFLRNLAKWSGKRDFREVRMQVSKVHNRDEVIASTIDEDRTEFNTMKLYISLGLKIHKVELFDFETMRREIDTKNLPKVRDL